MINEYNVVFVFSSWYILVELFNEFSILFSLLIVIINFIEYSIVANKKRGQPHYWTKQHKLKYSDSCNKSYFIDSSGNYTNRIIPRTYKESTYISSLENGKPSKTWCRGPRQKILFLRNYDNLVNCLKRDLTAKLVRYLWKDIFIRINSAFEGKNISRKTFKNVGQEFKHSQHLLQ